MSLAGYREGMAELFAPRPRMSSWMAHHVCLTDRSRDELLAVARGMVEAASCRPAAEAGQARPRGLEWIDLAEPVS